MTLKGAEQLRYWTGALLMSGLFGLPGFELIKNLIKWTFGEKDIELELKKAISESGLPAPVKRTVLYGAFSNLGIDIGRRVGMGDFIPSSSQLLDYTGPAVSTIVRLVEAMPKIFNDANFLDTIEVLSPGLANPMKAFLGETRDKRRGRTRFKYETAGEKIARATGFRPTREAIESDAIWIANYEQRQRSETEIQAIDAFIRVMDRRESLEYKEARDRLRELKIDPARVMREAHIRNLGTDYERKLLQNRKKPEAHNGLVNYGEMAR